MVLQSQKQISILQSKLSLPHHPLPSFPILLLHLAKIGCVGSFCCFRTKENFKNEEKKS